MPYRTPFAALPALLKTAAEHRAAAWKALRQVVGAAGKLSLDSEERLERIEKLFGAPAEMEDSR